MARLLRFFADRRGAQAGPAYQIRFTGLEDAGQADFTVSCPRPLHITVAQLQAHLDLHDVVNRNVVALRDTVPGSGLCYSAQPSGFFFVDNENELKPGTYDAVLSVTENRSSSRRSIVGLSQRPVAAPASVEGDYPDLVHDDESAMAATHRPVRPGQVPQSAGLAHDVSRVLTVPAEDVSRAAACVEALRAGSRGVARETRDPIVSSSEGALEALNRLLQEEKHDYIAAAVSRAEAPLRYMVAVSATTVAVAIDCSTNSNMVEALLNPGAPVHIDTADGGAANGAAVSIASLLPYSMLLSLCDKPDDALIEAMEPELTVGHGGPHPASHVPDAETAALTTRSNFAAGSGSPAHSGSATAGEGHGRPFAGKLAASTAEAAAFDVEANVVLIPARSAAIPTPGISNREGQQVNFEAVSDVVIVNGNGSAGSAAAASSLGSGGSPTALGSSPQSPSGVHDHLAALRRAPLQSTMARLGLGRSGNAGGVAGRPRDAYFSPASPGVAVGASGTTVATGAAPTTRATAGASTSDSASVSSGSSTSAPRRRLIFCGESISGAVAHVAAIFARHLVRQEESAFSSRSGPFRRAAAQRELRRTIEAITFSSPFVATHQLASTVMNAGEQFLHVNICAEHDILPRLATLAAEASAAYALSQDNNTDARQAAQAARALLLACAGSMSGAEAAELLKSIQSIVRKTEDMVNAHRHNYAVIRLHALGQHAYLHRPASYPEMLRSSSHADDNTVHFEHTVGVMAASTEGSLPNVNTFGDQNVQLVGTHPNRLPARLQLEPTLSGVNNRLFRDIDEIARDERDVPQLISAHRVSCQARYASVSTVGHRGTTELLTCLRPKVRKCAVTMVGGDSRPVRTDFTLSGKNLESVLCRPSRVAGGIGGGQTTLSALLLLDGFQYDADEPVFVVSNRSDEARLLMSKCRANERSVLAVRTDFGDSSKLTVTSVSRTEDVLSGAYLYANLNADLLEAAFLRGMLSMIYHLDDMGASAASETASIVDGFVVVDSPGRLDMSIALASSGHVGGRTVDDQHPGSNGASSSTVGRRPLTTTAGPVGASARVVGVEGASAMPVSRDVPTGTGPSGRSPMHLHPLLQIISELEQIIVGTCKTADIAQQHMSINGLYYAQSQMQPIFKTIVDFMVTPVQLKYRSQFMRGIMMALGGLGIMVGGVLTIVGAIATLPALVPAIATAAVMASGSDSTGRRVATATLLVPTAILMIPGGLTWYLGTTIVGRSMRAVRDPPSQQYLQMLKVLLMMLAGDPDRELEEIPVLEIAICRRLRSFLPAYLAVEEASMDDVRQALDAHFLSKEASAGPASPGGGLVGPLNNMGSSPIQPDAAVGAVDVNLGTSAGQNLETATVGSGGTRTIADGAAEASQLYARVIPESRVMLVRWLLAVTRLARLRHLIQRELVISFVGVHNSGKSSMIRSLFGLDVSSDLLRRTENVQMFRLACPTSAQAAVGGARLGDAAVEPAAATVLEDAQAAPVTYSSASPGLILTGERGDLVVDVADFPGMTDERQHVAGLTQRMSDITTVFVCMFRVGHVAAPERRLMDLVRAKGKDFIVLINWVDTLAPEDQARLPEIQENYARALNIPAVHIIFTSINQPDRVEHVRKLIFSLLQMYSGIENAPRLAMIMTHPAVRAALAADAVLASDWRATSRALADIFQNMSLEPVSPALVHQKLHHAQTTDGYFVPILTPTCAASTASTRHTGQLGRSTVTTRDGDRQFPRLSRRGTSQIDLDPSLVLETRLVDLLSALGYDTLIVQCSVRVLRRLLVSSARQAGATSISELVVLHQMAVALAPLTSSAEGGSSSELGQPRRVDHQEFVLTILVLVNHINDVVIKLREMQFGLDVILEAIDHTDFSSLQELTVDTLLDTVVERQAARDAATTEALVAVAEQTAHPEQRRRPSLVHPSSSEHGGTTSSAADVAATGDHAAEGEELPNTHVGDDDQSLIDSRWAEAIAVPEETPGATAEVGKAATEPGNETGAGRRSVDFSSSARNHGTATMFQSGSLIRGLEIIHLVSSRTRFTICDRVRARTIYPSFHAGMTLPERTALFAVSLESQGVANSDITTATQIELPSDEPDKLYASMIESIMRYTPDQLRCGVRISFANSEAVDVKGVLRGVMDGIAEHLRAGGSPFWSTMENGELYFSPYCYRARTEASKELMALGRLVGLCLQDVSNNIRLPACFALPVFKLLLGEPIGLPDLETMYPSVGSSIKQMCHMDEIGFDQLALTYSVDVSAEETYDLCQNGSQVDVTAEKRVAYLVDRTWFHLGRGLPLMDFVLGVGQTCRRDLLALFTPAMLQLLLHGQSDFSVGELRAGSTVSPQFDAHPQLIEWFWRSVEEMSPDERRLLLAFVTGSSTIPAAGVASLRFTIVPYQRGPSDSLPVSHTCFYMLELPLYESFDQLNDRLRYAINNVSSGQFGSA